MQEQLDWLERLGKNMSELPEDDSQQAEAVLNRISEQPSHRAIQVCERLLDHPQLRTQASVALAKTGWISAIEILCRRLATSSNDEYRSKLVTELTWNAKDVLNQPEYRALYEPVLVSLFEQRWRLDHLADWSSHLPAYDTLHGLIRIEAHQQVEAFVKDEEDPDYDALDFFFGYFHACIARGNADEILDVLSHDAEEVFAETSAYYYLTEEFRGQKDLGLRDQLLRGLLEALQSDDVVRGDWAISFLQYLGTARVIVPLLKCLTSPITKWQETALSALQTIASGDTEEGLLNMADQDPPYLNALQNLAHSTDATIAKWAEVFIKAYYPEYKA